MKKWIACVTVLAVVLLMVPLMGLFTAAETKIETRYLEKQTYEDGETGTFAWHSSGMSTHTVVSGGKDSDHALQSVMADGMPQNRLQVNIPVGEGEGQWRPGVLYTLSYDVKAAEAGGNMTANAYVNTSNGQIKDIFMDFGTNLTTDWQTVVTQLQVSISEENKLHARWRRTDMDVTTEQDLADLSDGEIITSIDYVFVGNSAPILFFDNVEITWEETVTVPDPTEPTNPTDPTDPTDPTEPSDPTDPTEPTEPTVPPVDPRPEDTAIIPNGNFESGSTEPWMTFGLSDLELVPGAGVDGSTALKTTMVTEQARATIALKKESIETGKIYDIASHLKAEEGKGGSVTLMFVISTEEMGESNVILDSFTVTGEWTEYHSYVQVNETEEGLSVKMVKNNYGETTTVIEGDSMTITGYYLIWLSLDMNSYYLDDLTAEAVEDFPAPDQNRPIIENGTFENGLTAPWYSLDMSTLSVVEDKGSKVLKVVQNEGTDHNRAQIKLETNALQMDTSYKLTTGIRGDKSGPVQVVLIVETKEMGLQNLILNVIQADTEWTKTQQYLKITQDEEVLEIAYTTSAGKSELWGLEADEITVTGWYLVYLSFDVSPFYLDDVEIVKEEAPAQTPSQTTQPEQTTQPTQAATQATAPAGGDAPSEEDSPNVNTGEDLWLIQLLIPVLLCAGAALVLLSSRRPTSR